MPNPSTLPNSLTRAPKVDHSISRPGTVWLILYCANCGHEGGRVLETELSEQFAFYLCNDCAEKHGSIAGTMMLPDHLFGIRKD
jgi:hypothetical protein